MAEITAFNPFVDRLSRDIRNGLSRSLAACLECGSITPAERIADGFLAADPGQIYVRYIKERLRRYGRAVDTIGQGPDDPFWKGFVLWDLELFFEMHEVLEHAWYTAEGDTRLIMQALIRAAGVYIKLECGLTPQARKIAEKSLAVLDLHRPFLDRYFPSDRLLEPLRSGRMPPPRLLSGR